MIKKYSQFIKEKNSLNEGLKDWLAAFMMMVNVGAVPVAVATSNTHDKKEFIEKQPQDKVDAARFVNYITKSGSDNPINKIWTDFISKNPDVKSNFNQVNKYITKDGKNYMFAKEYQKQDFSHIDIHKFTPVNYLTDMGGFIDDSLEPKINNFIYDYEKKTSVEVCIITVPTLDGESEFDYAQSQFDRIKIGKEASDNGILIVVSMEDRRWRIHTGYGVEGLLPDATCFHIGEDIIKPNFKKGNYYDGIMGSLEEIKKIIDRNPDDLKKWKEEQEEKSSAEMHALLTNIGYGALILAMISTLLILVYRKWKSAEEMMEEVAERLEKIDKMRKPYKDTGIEEVDSLYNKFRSIINKYAGDIDKLNKSGEAPKFYQIGKHADFLMNQKKRIESLGGIYDEIANAYKTWGEKRNRLIDLQDSISEYNLSGIISSIDLGFKAWNQLKSEYGVDAPYNAEKLKTKASELSDIINKVDTAYKSSISEAEKILSTYKSKESSISSEVSNVKSQLSKYKTAEQKLNNWKSLVDSAISEMNRYKRWSRSGESSQIDTSVSQFSSKVKGYDKSNLIKMAGELESLLSTIESMKTKWRRRKEEEEEEERRIKRRKEEEEESHRRSSSSSSDSGSSFGGFGGGSSGGGGSGGGW